LILRIGTNSRADEVEIKGRRVEGTTACSSVRGTGSVESEDVENDGLHEPMSPRDQISKLGHFARLSHNDACTKCNHRPSYGRIMMVDAHYVK
jgi:hypothetical protein